MKENLYKIKHHRLDVWIKQELYLLDLMNNGSNYRLVMGVPFYV